ncbi:MAG TPA: hypothetical protein VKX49_12800 [Bryobacteraceae bacterium]|nr:hypothetical protein [Bryobacteraceae bacterium]
MNQILSFLSAHASLLTGFGAMWVYAALIQTMPTPKQEQQWYGWLYNFLHVIGANFPLVGKKTL